MGLTRQQLEALREEAMAEDVEIDLPRMSLWSVERARAFFECGGRDEAELSAWLRSVALEQYDANFRLHFADLDAIRRRLLAALPADAALSAAVGRAARLAAANKVLDVCAVRDEAHRATLRECLAALAMLGQQGPLDLPSIRGHGTHASLAFGAWLGAKLPPLAAAEARGAVRRGAREGARVRLLALYGINDSSRSFGEWEERAPPWVEVRPLELPGLGEREGEATCLGEREDVGGREEALAHINRHRRQLVCSIADAVAPLTAEPYGIFGFSLGAMLGYLLVVELQQRGLPPPLLFIVAGRGPPDVQMPGQTDETKHLNEAYVTKLVGLGDAQVLQAKDEIAAPDEPRLYKWTAEERRPALGRAWRSGLLLACGPLDPPPEPITSCAVLAIASELDTMWPPDMLHRWEQVSGAGFEYALIQGASHFRLMTAPDLISRTMAELAVHAAIKASDPMADARVQHGSS
ncbi:hypothetical protein AB1Y20_015123 [Prymnesium parvum]|uniref:Thioesterase domain-containing protein n=1 Tax=Prymnesium parvum TaxID=97485 RepID=A0AB34K0J6_PRYPA